MPRKNRGFTIVFLFFLFIPGFLIAQSSRNLNLGTWLTGTLFPGGEEWFSVRAPDTGFLFVETSGYMDTYLEAYDASRSLIDEDDDGGEGNNARLEIFVEANAAYLFKLRFYDENKSGPYRIVATFEPSPPDTSRNTERSRAELILLGASTPVYFRASESRWYRCNASGTGTLFTVYTRGTLDTLLALYDSQGRLLEEDDDSGEGSNARLSVPGGLGLIYIEVKTYNARTGQTTLYTEAREPGRPDQYEPDNTMATAKDINLGEAQQRTFTDADDVDWVRLRITQTAFYAISSAAFDRRLDSYLELYDVNGNLIDEDDDSGDNYDAYLIIRLFPGTYYIKVRCINSDPLDDNRYTLSVEMADPQG
jgi:hypothetical protein